MFVTRSSLRSCYSQSLLSYVPPCAIADTCELASCSYDAKQPHRGRSYRVALNAWAHSPHTANHPKIVIIRALYRDPMPLIRLWPDHSKVASSTPVNSSGSSPLSGILLLHGGECHSSFLTLAVAATGKKAYNRWIGWTPFAFESIPYLRALDLSKSSLIMNYFTHYFSLF